MMHPFYRRMSLVLSGLTAVAGDTGLQRLSLLSSLVALGWLKAAWRLSKLVPTKAEAEAVHSKGKLESR
jgi:hypothetical protein